VRRLLKSDGANRVSDPTDKEKIAEVSRAISKERDCDIIVFNYSMENGLHHLFQTFLKKRKTKKKNLVLIVTTEGGDPDSTYRIARCLQNQYDSITIIVAGWCKSAGTLLCIAANELIVADSGELGPLDIQIAKSDELGERSSGLAVGAAFEKLQEESFQLFIRNLSDIKSKIGGRITFRTAADIAAQMVIGVTSDVFAKFDPISIGEDHRANLVAEEYATRLNLKARNLRADHRMDGMQMLLRGYPSHGFVIDREEAAKLFRVVKAPTGQISELLDLLGTDIVFPLSSSQNHKIRLEFLNAEKSARSKAKGPKRRRRAGAKPASAKGDTTVIRGHLPARVEQDPGSEKAA
jgi:hypothetical protein